MHSEKEKYSIMNNITPKEKEVLGLLAKGFSSKEIACQLFISVHTVESHRKNLRFKFDAKNSSELIMKAATGALM
jgi:DNA-binding CsgD family transcriptional regulator